MLSDFTWNMTGYIPKYAVNPHGDGIIPYMAERIFQLEPEPPAVGSLNEYILSALREKNLIYFSFFLHHYEPQLNKRIKGFWGVDGGDLYDTDRFIDIKLSCREQMLQKLMDYDPASGAERAYRRAVDKLTELLVAEGAIHAVRLKQKSKTKRKKKIATAIYEYQADCDGEWGQISFDFENGTSEIVRLADWDTMKTNRFANKAIAYLLNCENEKLPKETIVAFEL